MRWSRCFGVYLLTNIGARFGHSCRQNPRFKQNSKSILGMCAEHARVLFLSAFCIALLFQSQIRLSISDSKYLLSPNDPINRVTDIISKL